MNAEHQPVAASERDRRLALFLEEFIVVEPEEDGRGRAALRFPANTLNPAMPSDAMPIVEVLCRTWRLSALTLLLHELARPLSDEDAVRGAAARLVKAERRTDPAGVSHWTVSMSLFDRECRECGGVRLAQTAGASERDMEFAIQVETALRRDLIRMLSEVLR